MHVYKSIHVNFDDHGTWCTLTYEYTLWRMKKTPNAIFDTLHCLLSRHCLQFGINVSTQKTKKEEINQRSALIGYFSLFDLIQIKIKFKEWLIFEMLIRFNYYNYFFVFRQFFFKTQIFSSKIEMKQVWYIYKTGSKFDRICESKQFENCIEISIRRWLVFGLICVKLTLLTIPYVR